MSLRMREPFNAVSHLVGAVLAAIGFVYLVLVSRSETSALIAYTIYGSTAVLLFSASAAYHWASRGGKWLQKVDHASIYLMIAGTYTPVCILGLTGTTQWAVLALQWGLAAIGVTATFALVKPPTWLRLVLYLVMGWTVLPLMGVLSERLPSISIGLIVAGGLAYTLGTVIYASKRPNPWPGKFGFHEIWHLFVLAGGLAHYFVMVTLANASA